MKTPMTERTDESREGQPARTRPRDARLGRRGAPGRSRFQFRFPDEAPRLDQDEEWFDVEHDGKRRRMRLHDYAGLYQVPGLYEALVYRTLRCSSPRRLTRLLTGVLEDWPTKPADLRVLDLGAGNGVVAEYLRREGVRQIVGLDLLPEAAEAAQRDRPGVYDDYLVADLCDLSPADRRRLESYQLNCLVTVAALGFGDIPPEAFANAVNLVADGGWVAMTIKEDFLDPSVAGGGFARLVRQMIDREYLEVQAHQRFCHRRSIAGDRLFYVAIIGRKMRAVPWRELVEDQQGTEGDAVAGEVDPAGLMVRK